MSVGPQQVVDTVPASPPRVSLLTSAQLVDGAAQDATWENGIAFEPERCNVNLDAASATDYPYWWDCPLGSGVTPEVHLTAASGEKAIGGSEDNIDYRPYTAWVGEFCSTLDWRQNGARRRDFIGRLERRFAACLPAIVEREFWAGTIATAAGFPNAFLTDAGVTELGGAENADPWVQAFAEMEQALGECSCGGQHMIHAQPRVVSYLASRGLVDRIPLGGSRYILETDLGTIVVPGVGYPGTSPAESAASSTGSWIYGTGLVRIWIGAARVDAVDATTVERALGDIEVRAERTVAAAWDDCCHISIGLDLCNEYCA